MFHISEPAQERTYLKVSAIRKKWSPLRKTNVIKSIPTNIRLDILTKKRKQTPLPGDDASMAEAASDGVERRAK